MRRQVWQRITDSEEIEEFRSDGAFKVLRCTDIDPQPPRHIGEWEGVDMEVRAYYDLYVIVAVLTESLCGRDPSRPYLRKQWWFKAQIDDMITDLLFSFSPREGDA